MRQASSESRSIAVALRLIRKHYPHIEWIISYADGTQCGDGTIYRAAGFVLTAISKNKTIWELGDMTFTDVSAKIAPGKTKEILNRVTMTKGKHAKFTGGSSMKRFREMGAKPKAGFQLRYIYFLNPDARSRLTVPEIPYSEIEVQGAKMYLGKKPQAQASKVCDDRDQRNSGGEAPT